VRAFAVLLSCALALNVLAVALAEPTPGVSASLDRIVPEARETNDYVSYEEARDYLDAIAAQAPDFIEVVEVGQSFGWDNIAAGHDTFAVLAVEVTNEASATPRAQKQAVVFQLSIHGNEKGGREGGLRVIEDLAIPRLYGEDYRALLDDIVVVFTFPNIDGWRHEEAPYRHNCGFGGVPFVGGPDGGPCIETQGFVRQNGNWQDMNRDWPTFGWYQTAFGREHALSEPEIHALQTYLLQFRGRTISAADIHGMLTPADGGITPAGALPIPFVGGDGGNGPRSHCLPENPLGVECATKDGHFVLGMVRGYQGDALHILRDVHLAEGTKQALIAMAEQDFPHWANSPNLGVYGGEFMEWGTVWDTLGYSDSGFTGLWFAQTLGASGVDYELSYNHIVFDNHYVPEVNAIHVASVRTIVRAYLDNAMAGVVPALQPERSIAYLDGMPGVPTAPAQQGPHANTTDDDLYETARVANPLQFWRDLARFAPPGSIVPVTAADIAAGRVAQGQLVVTDATWDALAGNPQAVQGLRAFAEAGGRLLLTDSALQALEALDLVAPGSVERGVGYMGYVDLDLEHRLAAGVRPLAHQTYEGVPLGYGLGEDSSPIWTVAADAVQGEVAGTSGEGRASVGILPLGQGEVVFIGALLPRASNDVYHPYGLVDYALSATGYQLVYNSLGIALDAVANGAEPPAASQGQEQPQRTPGVEGALAILGLAGIALLARRRAA
jgi:MYXO-CTERM domain-containing protein